MLANERDAVSRVSSFLLHQLTNRKTLVGFPFSCLYSCSSCGFCSLASVDYFIDACVDYSRLCCFQRFILAPVPPFPLKSNNSTLRVYVGLSLCVNVIFCEKDLITKFNKVYFFFSSVAGCLIFSLVNLCLIYYRQL